MENHAVAALYKKVVSPSLKFTTEEWSKQRHYRHTNYHGLSPSFRRQLVVSPSRSTCSAPGRVESQLAIQSASPLADDEDSQSGHYHFQPTTSFKKTSLPAMPLSKKYTPSIAGTVRSVPVSVARHSAVSLPDRLPHENPRVLFTSQRQRWEAEEKARSQSRRLKRTSEIVSHRMDKHYYMAGMKIPMQGRWQVDSNDLLQLKLLAHRKQLAEYQKLKNPDYLDSRDSPGGQMSTPTPGEDERRQQSRALSSNSEGAWAETASDASSVDEFDSISMRGEQQNKRVHRHGNRKGRGNKEKNGDLTIHGVENGETGETGAGDESKIEELNSLKEKGLIPEDDEKNKDTSDREAGKSIVKHSKSNTTSNKEGEKNTPTSKSPKKGRIRFKDEVNTSRGRKTPTKENKDEKSAGNEGTEPEEKRENKYLNEWLGIKKKEVDGRYKPGKPPPNRIFLSSDPTKAKKDATKFSDVFLTEISTIQPQEWSEEEESISAKYGIINSKQQAAFKSMFEEVDKDKNGSVTLEELKLRMMPAISRDDIKHFVQVFDLNKDQTIDRREFTAICALNDRLAGLRTETADGSIALNLQNLAQHIVIFKEMYKIMDEDDDNRLDANELLVMVSAGMETEIGADLEQAKAVLEGARDEFGYIDFVGFLAYIPFFAKLLKSIMNKPLSISEIEQARERVKIKDLTFTPKKPIKEPKSWEVF
ncbi:uncharacterized protein LOC5508068 [Nematostella vectensis]|uniref:uncharacterized protein LOC5508068 n=1 Tax=Nematostella vectensis TaxID=45351 RepID=UPI002076D83F|nr:uncharacterized protein LOC5508068 [Nematostella vectensis]